MNKSVCVSTITNADSYIKNAADRSRILTIAIAIAVAYSSNIPSVRVGDADSYFNNQESGSVRNAISVWNDSVVINWKECVELVRKFWKIRYSTMYPDFSSMFVKSECFFESIFNVPQHFSIEQVTYFEEHSGEIIPISRKISEAIYNDSKVVTEGDPVPEPVIAASAV